MIRTAHPVHHLAGGSTAEAFAQAYSAAFSRDPDGCLVLTEARAYAYARCGNGNAFATSGAETTSRVIGFCARRTDNFRPTQGFNFPNLPPFPTFNFPNFNLGGRRLRQQGQSQSQSQQQRQALVSGRGSEGRRGGGAGAGEPVQLPGCITS